MVGVGRRLFPDLEAYKSLWRVDERSYDTGVVFLVYEALRR